MQKLNLILLALYSLSLIACSGMTSEPAPDPADAFVGYYEVSTIENVTWGSSSGTINNTSEMYIDKLSSNRVQAYGYISTEGEIVGNKVYFEPHSITDSKYGYLNYVYDEGVLNGNVLTLSSVMTGQLSEKEYGTKYPVRSTIKIIAIKGEIKTSD